MFRFICSSATMRRYTGMHDELAVFVPTSRDFSLNHWYFPAKTIEWKMVYSVGFSAVPRHNYLLARLCMYNITKTQHYTSLTSKPTVADPHRITMHGYVMGSAVSSSARVTGSAVSNFVTIAWTTDSDGGVAASPTALTPASLKFCKTFFTIHSDFVQTIHRKERYFCYFIIADLQFESNIERNMPRDTNSWTKRSG
jgi:hypothetical protein